MIVKSNLDWNRFKIFYHVAKAGSFTEAGHLLHLSQSALTRTIQKLEAQIQIKLFIRTHKGVMLTPQGRTMFESVRKMYEEFIQCDIEVQKVEQEAQGALKVALLRRLSSSSLMEHMLNFQMNYPQIALNLIFYDKKVEDFKSLEVDMALMPSFRENSDLYQGFVCSLQQKLYASPSYLKANGIPQTLNELSYHRMIEFGQENSYDFSLCKSNLKDRSSGSSPFCPNFYVNSCEEMRRATEHGLGIAALTVETNSAYQFHLVEVLPELMAKEIPLHFIYPHYLKAFKKVQLFETYMKKALQAQEPASKAYTIMPQAMPKPYIVQHLVA